ncbi:TetR/AcrR family transcriptional regulator [Bacillus sp. FJAT-42376]|uniref:TetR/AcrR family transcriptional regulator n=1 Tax=Bacillus sp. FJAT-42376 TaxID=2014076 RepID=UPI000F4FDC53|nr:TetR/AcrR family transcriptional regulator [Bacillus sp. FJAT-42376]AZB42253.1 TetR/AcrR family transcriptional regulator [Bacillus sp. FJAT-42376]
MSVDRKQLIMDAATKSFTQFGYKATTMDLVAKQANVGKGTIYTFFRKKEELFDEIIKLLLAEMRHSAEESFRPDTNFLNNVHRALYQLLEFRKDHQLTIKIFQESSELGTPEVQEVVSRLEGMVISYIKEKIQAAVEKGELSPCDPELTAFLMLKLYVSLIFDWEKQHAPLPKEKIAELFELYFLKGLSVRESGFFAVK